MKHLELVRKMVQEKIPDKRVRSVWFLSVDIQDNILYGINGNNNSLFAIAKISPVGDIEILR